MFPYGEAMANKSLLLLIVIAALSLTGCPSGDNGGSSGGSLASSGSVVYLADQNTDGVFELFLASSGAKLNGPLVTGGNVVSFALTPDKSAVVYIADQTTDQVFELFRVLFATPQASTLLNPAFPAGRAVAQFALTPDSTKVVYIADQDT